MTTTLPPTIGYGKVIGRFIRPDGNSGPVPVPASGTVQFIPKSLASVHLDIAPRTGLGVGVDFEVKTAELNANGEVTNPADGSIGYWLAAGIYYCKPVLIDATWPKFEFVVGEEHTDENPLDLIKITPSQRITGFQVLASADTALRAEDAAINAGLSATYAETQAVRAEDAANTAVAGPEAAWWLALDSLSTEIDDLVTQVAALSATIDGLVGETPQ